MKKILNGAIPPWGDPSVLCILSQYYPLSSCKHLLFVKLKNFSVMENVKRKKYWKSVTYVGELSVTYVTD